MTVRPRVLMIAEACNPAWVSVPLVGWSIYHAVAKVADVHLVTQIRNRQDLIDFGLQEGRDFTAIDSEAVARGMWKVAQLLRGGSGKGWTTVAALAALAYPYFEKLLWDRFANELRRGDWDIVHRVTPLSPVIGSPIAPSLKRLGVPFMLGPLNGGVPWPKQFDSARRQEREWLSYVRNIYKLLPGYWSTRSSASAIIVASRDTRDQLARSVHDRTVYIPENAINPERFSLRRTRKAELPIRLVFVGRLVPYKGADMLIEAAADGLRDGWLTLEIVGDGPQMPQLRELVSKLGLDGKVQFAGWVPHQDVQKRLVDADLFAFPSIREFGGAVALEAMAIGVPPAVVAYGGLAELASEKTSFLVPMGARTEIVAQFKQIFDKVKANPAVIDEKSGAAVRRAHELFTWDAKAQQILKVYDWVMGKAAKPDFPLPAPDLD